MRFQQAQSNRTLNHPSLPQPTNDEVGPLHVASGDSVQVQDLATGDSSCGKSIGENINKHGPAGGAFSFVVSADTQFGMAKDNLDWADEIEYSKVAVSYINGLEPRPLFCCVCGDLVHMTSEIYATNNKSKWNRQECDDIQDNQIKDFQNVWGELHSDIALVCLCGNHDVGNRPTPTSIQRFRARFGDDWLAFWAKNCYNIVVNSSLFHDASGAEDYYADQLQWLEGRLQYALDKKAQHIFVFGHHPWFLYHEEEDKEDMEGYSPLPPDLGIEGGKVDDSYFHIPKKQRMIVLALFRKYNVTAAFSGHFHQNLVSTSSFGMKMIVTSSLSCVMESTGIPKTFDEPKTRGIRIVHIGEESSSFSHKFVSL